MREAISHLNPWLVLITAITCGVIGTTFLKLSQGFEKRLPLIGTGIFYGVSFAALTQVFNEIDLGVGYAVWSGLSTVMITLIGSIFFQESLNSLKIMSLILIILGVIGLNFG